MKTDIDAIQTLRTLQGKLDDYRRRRAKQAGWVRRFIPTTLAAVDDALPHGGVPSGSVTEILADQPGVGSLSLSMRIAGQCVGSWGAGAGNNASPVCPCVIFVDVWGDFYPPAAVRWGIDWQRLIVIRPRSAQEAFWAVDQSLRCSAVATVIAPLNRLDERQSRRLQLAAESSGCVGLILRPARSRSKSFAAVRMLLEGVSPKEVLADDPLPAIDQSRDRKEAVEHAQRTTAPLRSRLCSTHRSRSGLGSESHVPHALNPSFPCSLVPSFPSPLRPSAPSSLPPPHDTYPCRITLLSIREGIAAGSILVDLHHETGALSVHPLPVDRFVARFSG